MTTGYYLLDNPNPHGNHFYTSRNRKLVGQVIHITASIEDIDLVGPDRTCEAEARYAATTDRQVSWHSGSDTDSFINLLPRSYTAFQVVNYNSSTAGHEISKLETNWKDDDPKLVETRLRLAANCLRDPMKQDKIPFRHASKNELDHAISTQGKPVGMVSHGDLDPDRRTDPGIVIIGGKRVDTFPWDLFIEILNDDVEDDMAGYSLADDERGKKWMHDQIQLAVQSVLKGGSNSGFQGLPQGEVTAVQQVEDKVDQLLNPPATT